MRHLFLCNFATSSKTSQILLDLCDLQKKCSWQNPNLVVYWHSKSVEWHSWMPIALSCLGVFWTHFLGFLESGLALRRVFNPYSKILNSFLDNSDPFSNNYLVDKYSKINLDKVQIIYNFIVIQLSPLFPCKHAYFRH